jgi:hypothetical protein
MIWSLLNASTLCVVIGSGAALAQTWPSSLSLTHPYSAPRNPVHRVQKDGSFLNVCCMQNLQKWPHWQSSVSRSGLEIER